MSAAWPSSENESGLEIEGSLRTKLETIAQPQEMARNQNAFRQILKNRLWNLLKHSLASGEVHAILTNRARPFVKRPVKLPYPPISGRNSHVGHRDDQDVVAAD